MWKMILERITGKAKRLLRRGGVGPANRNDRPALDLYWDPAMAEVLERWGEGNAWSEIQLLLATARGRALDIACGTGKVISILAKFPHLEVEGCDISDFLIEKAIARGIDRNLLKVCDAARTGYEDKRFDYSYSIGSIEHFQEDGILAFLAEAKRITKQTSFHHLPVSRTGDEGWISPYQSYFNNGLEWWLRKFRGSFPEVFVLPSNWSDDKSVGKWFVCRCRDDDNS